MTTAALEEKSMAAIGFNRYDQYANEVKLVARYRDGRHVEDWQFYRMSELAEEVFKLATAWRLLDLKPQEAVAIMSPNRPRWATTFSSLIMTNAVVVPVYTTLTG